MGIHPSKLLGRIASLAVGTVLALAITLLGTPPLVLIALLSLSIGTIAMLSHSEFDFVLCIVTGAAFLLPMNNVRLSATLTVGDGLITIAFLFIVVVRTGQHALHLSGMDGLLIGIAMVVFGGLLGSFFAASAGASVAGLVRFGAATMALPVVFGLWRPSVPQIRIIAWSYVLGSTLSVIVGILFIRLQGRAQGLANHPNHLALASLMAVGIGLGLAMSTDYRGHYMLLLGLVALLTAGILSSGSRSGLIDTVLVLAVIAILTHDRRLIIAVTTAAVLFLLMLAFGQLGSSGTSAVARLLGGGGAVASDQARTETLRAALHSISLHPLTGQGFQDALATHDIVLELAATTGVFGILGFTIVGWITIRPTWRRFRWGAMRRTRPEDALLIGTIAAVIGFIANGLVAPQLYDRYIWIVVTMAVALNRELIASDRASVRGIKLEGKATKTA